MQFRVFEVDLDVLKKVGLSNQQALVYLKLLGVGHSSVSQLAKVLNIPRVSCHDTLSRLLSLGLAFKKKGEVSEYIAAPLERLLGLVEEKELDLLVQKQAINDLMGKISFPADVARFKEDEVAIFRSKQGVKSFFDTVLQSKSPLHVLGGTGRLLKEMRVYFTLWRKKRARNGVRSFLLFNRGLELDDIVKAENAEVRFFRDDCYSSATTFLFGDSVAILLHCDVPVIIMLNSASLSKTYLNYFKFLWHNATVR